MQRIERAIRLKSALRERPRRRRREARPPGSTPVTSVSLREERALAFALAGLLPLYVALADGGLDRVVHQGVAVALWWAIALALLFHLLPRARAGNASRFALAAGGGVVAWALLSLLWTDSAELTTAEVARDIGLLGIPAVCVLGLNRDTWSAAAAGLSVVALAIPALAVLSRVAPDLIGEARLDSLASPRRLAFPLDYWNALGAWAAMAVGIGVGWSAHLRRPDLRALALAAVPVAAVCVYLTYSRGAVLAVAVAGVAAVGLARHRLTAVVHAVTALAATAAAIMAVRGAEEIAEGAGGSGGAGVALVVLLGAALAGGVAVWTLRADTDRVVLRPRSLRWAGAALGAAALVLAFALVSGVQGNAFDAAEPLSAADPAARLTSAGGTRDELWGSAFDAYVAQPITGLGPGTFELWWQRGGAEREQVRDAHSLYLETLAERGPPGFFLIVAFLGFLLVAALAGRRVVRSANEAGAAAGLIAAFLAFLVQAGVDWMWEATAVSVLALSAAAIAAAAAASRRERLQRSRAGLAVLVALAIAAGMAQVPGLVSLERLRASQSAFAAELPPEAVRLAEDAIQAEPWAASPYAWRSYLRLRLDRLEGARRDARAAVRREPTNPIHRLQVARVEVARENYDEARAALDALVRLGPGYAELVDETQQALSELETTEEGGQATG